jgi:hypothetical protein
VPVTITAIPNPGYTFSHWQSPNLIPTPNTNKSVTLNVNQNQTFTAYFTGSSAPLNITVSEVNYHSSPDLDAGDWFEIHNRGGASVNLGNWKFQDYKDYNVFTFPENTIIYPGGYLVVCSDTVKFKTAFPTATKYIGQFNFNLGNDGDMIRIFNYRGDQIISFTYDDKAPWPQLADGHGYTLELVPGSANLNNSSSWFAGCLYGSPCSPYNSSCILSVDEEEGNSFLSVFPNPSKAVFHLSFNAGSLSDYQYSIISSTGQVLKKGTWNKISGDFKTELDFSDIPPGIYSLIINSGENYFSKKLIRYE